MTILTRSKQLFSLGLLFLVWGPIPITLAQANLPESGTWQLAHLTTPIVPNNVTRTFGEMGIALKLVADQARLYEATSEGMIHSSISTGKFLAILQCKFNATWQDISFPVPTTGYQLSVTIGNSSLGSARFKPSVTHPQSEDSIYLSNYLENIAEDAILTLTVTATFQAMGHGEQAVFEILPSSMLTIVAESPVSNDPENGIPNEPLETTDLITVGPVVLRPLEAWKGLASPQGFILKVIILCILLGVTLNFLKRRKIKTEQEVMESTQLLLEELADEDAFTDEISQIGLGG